MFVCHSKHYKEFSNLSEAQQITSGFGSFVVRDILLILWTISLSPSEKTFGVHDLSSFLIVR